MKLRAFLSALALLGFALPATAQPYPHRTVSVVVPYPAGGSVDVVARLVAQKLSESMGANFIVENRAGGAGGAVGANVVAKAAPDGYTLMLTASIHIITPFLNNKIPYDAVKDFAPVSLLAAGEIHLRDIELRFGRASGGRAAQARCRRRHARDRLQGRRSHAQRHHGRTDPADRRPDGVIAAARGLRQDQGARRNQHEARRGRAGYPDHRGVRDERL
jgi:hypothetical protein